MNLRKTISRGVTVSSPGLPVPSNIYYGKQDIWEKSSDGTFYAEKIFCLSVIKATVKKIIFAENLAAAFARPRWDVSFSCQYGCCIPDRVWILLKKQEVTFRPGPICCARQHGGFAVSRRDLIWAKSEALAVLHWNAVIFQKKLFDVPGYGADATCYPATRFIAHDD